MSTPESGRPADTTPASPPVVLPTATEATVPSTDAELRELALKRLKKRQDFRAHLVVYVVVNAFLWALWALTSRAFPWPVFVTLGWGIGLVMNAWDVYGRKEITAADVEREMERLRAD